MRSIRLVAVIAAGLCACGDDGAAGPDANLIDDSDVPTDTPPLPSGCDYAETDDMGNDDVTQDGAPELTGHSLTSEVVICGQVDTGNHDATSETLDVDGYAVNLPAGPVFITLSGGPELATLGDASLGIYSGTDFATVEAEEALVTSHALAVLELPAGAYEFALLSSNGTPISAAIPYKIHIRVDQPAQRCPQVTAPANHTEGTDNGANDVVVISYTGGGSMVLTTSGADAPATTSIGLLPGTPARITGSLANAAISGAYKDADTFAFSTGPSTDQLTVRLNWPGTADLDWFLFEAGVPAVASSSDDATMEDELNTIPVKPNTTYWIWAGLFEDSTGPIAYDLSLCGAQFDPP